LGRHPRGESSSKRVTVISRSGKPKRPSLRITSQKEVDTKGNNNTSKDTSLKTVISGFYFLWSDRQKNIDG